MKDLPYFAAKGKKPFVSAASARTAIERLGQPPENYEIKSIGGGAIAVLRIPKCSPDPRPVT